MLPVAAPEVPAAGGLQAVVAALQQPGQHVQRQRAPPLRVLEQQRQTCRVLGSRV